MPRRNTTKPKPPSAAGARSRRGTPAPSSADKRSIHARTIDWFFTGSPLSGKRRSPKEIADDLELGARTVYGWQDGSTGIPALAHILRIARVDDLNPTWLLLGLGQPSLTLVPEGAKVNDVLRERLALRLAVHFEVEPDVIEAFLDSESERPEDELFRIYAERMRKWRRQQLRAELRRFYEIYLKQGGEPLPMWSSPFAKVFTRDEAVLLIPQIAQSYHRPKRKRKKRAR